MRFPDEEKDKVLRSIFVLKIGKKTKDFTNEVLWPITKIITKLHGNS